MSTKGKSARQHVAAEVLLPKWPCPNCRGSGYLYRPAPSVGQAFGANWNIVNAPQMNYEAIPCPACKGGKVAERRSGKDRRRVV